MIICHKREELRRVLDGFRLKKQSLGFVPTMGALHQGHLSLIDQGLQENALMVVSIFVNPTQFDNATDLIKYPRTFEHDIELLQSFSERIVVYAPTVEDIYGDTIAAKAFDFDGLEYQMEGKFRKGHFDGVGTVVKRLFEIVQPDYAYFGEKDFQQLRIIQKLVEKYDLNVQVVGCDIFRAGDGLAMSSRNQRLSEAHRAAAPFIYQTLIAAKLRFGTENAKEVTEWVGAQFDKQALLELEYFIIADENTLLPLETKENTKSYRAFIAVFAGEIRLIDNIALN